MLRNYHYCNQSKNVPHFMESGIPVRCSQEPPPRALSRAKIIQSTSSRAMWTGLLHYSSIYAEIFRVVLYFIFTHQNSVSIFFSLINATCPFPFNLLHVIRPTLKIVDKENKMCSQSLCSLFQAYLLAPS